MCILKNKYLSFYKSLDNEFCTIPIIDTNYVPQGVCQINDFVIISCYDYRHEKNSVLFVCSRDRKKIVHLDSKIHCGGICYHKPTDSLYVTGKGIEKKSFINRYCGKSILNTKNNSTVYVEKIYCVDNTCELYSTSAKHSSPGYITCYGNELYIGNFVEFKHINEYNGIIKKYKILSNGDISTTFQIFNNPYSNTQGLCIYKYNGIIYYIFSRSFGRSRNSLLNISILKNQKFYNLNAIVLPCMSQQINKYNDKLIIIFESFASCYSYNAINSSKSVYMLNFSKLIQYNDNYRDFCKGNKIFVNSRDIKING